MFVDDVHSVEALLAHLEDFQPEIQGDLKECYGFDSVETGEQAFNIASCYFGDAFFDAITRELMCAMACNPRSPDIFSFVFAHRPTLALLRAASPWQNLEVCPLEYQ